MYGVRCAHMPNAYLEVRGQFAGINLTLYKVCSWESNSGARLSAKCPLPAEPLTIPYCWWFWVYKLWFKVTKENINYHWFFVVQSFLVGLGFRCFVFGGWALYIKLVSNLPASAWKVLESSAPLGPEFFFKAHFIFICMTVYLFTCICTTCVCAWRSQERVPGP